MQEVTGNTLGLKASQIKALERLYRRRVAPADVVSYELAQTLCEVSAEMHRQVGIPLDRRGAVEHVMVGDASKITLPDVGRMRGAPGRFRGLRLIHTHLRGESLTRDDMTDLAPLRLDMVAAVGVDAGGRAGMVHMGHLLPDNADGDLWTELPAVPAFRLDIDFLGLISGLEAESARKTRAVTTTEPGATRALLVHVAIGRARDSEARIAELRELCRTAKVEVLDVLEQRRPEPDPRWLVGKGKLEQI